MVLGTLFILSVLWPSRQLGIEFMLLFFFQAEDCIRDRDVTGVQTCALPIWRSFPAANASGSRSRAASPLIRACSCSRSEERRVGKSVDLGGRRIIKKKNPLQLLETTILSAQCTDKRVNMDTPALFAKYPAAADYAAADFFFSSRRRHTRS